MALLWTLLSVVGSAHIGVSVSNMYFVLSVSTASLHGKRAQRWLQKLLACIFDRSLPLADSPLPPPTIAIITRRTAWREEQTIDIKYMLQSDLMRIGHCSTSLELEQIRFKTRAVSRSATVLILFYLKFSDNF